MLERRIRTHDRREGWIEQRGRALEYIFAVVALLLLIALVLK